MHLSTFPHPLGPLPYSRNNNHSVLWIESKTETCLARLRAKLRGTPGPMVQEQLAAAPALKATLAAVYKYREEGTSDLGLLQELGNQVDGPDGVRKLEERVQSCLTRPIPTHAFFISSSS